MRRAAIASVAWVAACAGGGHGGGGSISSSIGSVGDADGSGGGVGTGDDAGDDGSAGGTGVDTDGGGSGGVDASGGPAEPGACPPGMAPSFPSPQWTPLPPDQAGMDPTAVDAFIATSGAVRGVLVRCGYLVASWGDPNEPMDWGGVTRPLVSTMLFFAVQEQRVGGVDDPVAPLGWGMQGMDAGITFRRLADETSGYGLPEGPGAAWGFNDTAGKIYADSVFDMVFGDAAPDDAVRDGARLGALAFEGALLTDVNDAVRLNASARDVARIGWFWANRGQWNGQALLPAATFDQFVQADVAAGLPRTVGGDIDDYLGVGSAGGGADQTGLGPGVYGFGWWFNPGGVAFPSAPDDTFVANGHWNGEVLAVVPSLGLVAAYQGAGADAETFLAPLDVTLGTLVDAVVE